METRTAECEGCNEVKRIPMIPVEAGSDPFHGLDTVLRSDLQGRGEADIARIVCYLEARATHPNEIDAGRYALGTLDREKDLAAASFIRATYEDIHGRPLRWARSHSSIESPLTLPTAASPSHPVRCLRLRLRLSAHYVRCGAIFRGGVIGRRPARLEFIGLDSWGR